MVLSPEALTTARPAPRLPAISGKGAQAATHVRVRAPGERVRGAQESGRLGYSRA